MPKAIKQPDLSAAVVCDANPLFTENEVEIISSECTADLVEIQKTDGIEIIIPRIAAGEILFRKAWALTNLGNDVGRKLRVLARLIDTPQPEFLSEKCLTQRLQRRFLRWCGDNRIILSSQMQLLTP